MIFVSSVNLHDFGNRPNGQRCCRDKTNATQRSRSQTWDTSASKGCVGRAKFRLASRCVRSHSTQRRSSSSEDQVRSLSPALKILRRSSAVRSLFIILKRETEFRLNNQAVF